MTTVSETIAARDAGIEVLGMPRIANRAAGITDQSLFHSEVTETAERVKEKFLGLVLEIIPNR